MNFFGSKGRSNAIAASSALPRRAQRRVLVAEDDARAQQRDALPAGRLVAVVALERAPRRHQQPLLARRAQARVDLVEASFFQHRLHRRDEARRGAREPFPVVDAGAALAVAAVQKHQVQIGAVTHLARAEAAEPQHGEAGAWNAVPLRERRQRRGDPLLEAGLGQIGQPARDLRRFEIAGHVVEADAQRLLGLKAADGAQLHLLEICRRRRRRVAARRRGAPSARRAFARARPAPRPARPTWAGAGAADRRGDRWCRTATRACASAAARRAGAASTRPSCARSGPENAAARDPDRATRSPPPAAAPASAPPAPPGYRRRPRRRGTRRRPPAAPPPRDRARDPASAPRPGASRPAVRPASPRSPRPPRACSAPPRRTPRDRRSRARRRSAPGPASSPGSRWVCVPVATWTRCSSRRQKRYADSSVHASRSPSRPATTSRGNARGVLRSRRSGRLPACSSCSAWTTISTSRIPPAPSLTSKPVSPSAPPASAGSRNSARKPRTSSIRRAPTLRGKMNGSRIESSSSPSARSPAAGRARSHACRSQVRPKVS